MKHSPKLHDNDLLVKVCPVHPTHEEHTNVMDSKAFCWRWQDLKVSELRITQDKAILSVVMTACLIQVKKRRNDLTA